MTDPARILVVDDEPNVRLVFRVALESVGYQTLMASDGVAALAELERSRVDLVLLDLQMPGIDGLETLRRLRETSNDVPVVIITAYGSVANAVQAMKVGAIDFVAKPLNPENLRQVVADVLRRHALAPATALIGASKAQAITVESHYQTNLRMAKRALNNRWFNEAEVFLKQALGLNDHSAEAFNLIGVLYELRGQHDASYHAYKAALKVQKDFGPAQQNMKRYYERFTFGLSTIPVNTGDPSN